MNRLTGARWRGSPILKGVRGAQSKKSSIVTNAQRRLVVLVGRCFDGGKEEDGFCAKGYRKLLQQEAVGTGVWHRS